MNRLAACKYTGVTFHRDYPTFYLSADYTKYRALEKVYIKNNELQKRWGGGPEITLYFRLTLDLN